MAELGTQVFFSRRDLFLFLKAVNYPELQGEVLSCDLPGSPAVCNWRPGLVLVNLNPEEASDKNPLAQAVGGSEDWQLLALVFARRGPRGGQSR